MSERMSGVSLEGWRIRRPPRRRDRPLRCVLVGEDPMALHCARRLADAGTMEVILSAESPAAAASTAEALAGRGRASLLLDGAAPCDVVVVFGDSASRARDVALWAARTCPLTAVVLASRHGLALGREAARTSGLPPFLFLSPGGMPRAAIEAGRLARRLDVSPSQVHVPAIGGDTAGAVPLRRYAAVAGVSARDLSEPEWRRWCEEPAPAITDAAIAGSVVRLARAVAEDRLEVLSCGAWVEGRAGMPGGFVTLPVRVGARGAEEPLPLKLAPEERAFLQRSADGAAPGR